MAAAAFGTIHRFYVIEVTIHAWDKASHEKDGTKASYGRPIYANEFGKTFIRMFGSVKPIKGELALKSLENVDFNCKTGFFENLNDEEHEDEYFSCDSDISE